MSESDGTSNGRTLVLFLSFAYSLQKWADGGYLEREIALYNNHAKELDHVYLVTYGDESDYQFTDKLANNVSILPKKYTSNNVLFSLIAPFVYWRVLWDADILKTDQMLGSWTAVLSKYIYRTSLLVRTGYVLSIFYDRQNKPLIIRYIARLIELIAYKSADGIITSSPRGKRYVDKKYSPSGNHRMIPNYIETNIFRPLPVDSDPDSLCFVGRLAPQKNLFALFEALEDLPYSLTVVGSGELSEELQGRANELGVDVEFVGTISNHKLPELLNRHEAFILPSLYEGMPKALLEAMACGLPVVGTDVVGINEVIEDGETGLLCDTEATAIHETVTKLMEDEVLREQLGTNARKEIVENYSLDEIACRERLLMEKVLT